MTRKIATCCYCSTRAVLVFDKGLHELSCQACGAPLREMKFMPQNPDKIRKNPPKTSRTQQKSPRKGSARFEQGRVHDKTYLRRPKRKSIPMARRFLEEIWDEVEDIFD